MKQSNTIVNSFNREFKDFNEIDNIKVIDFRGLSGSVRLFLKRIKLRKESDKIVTSFLKIHYKPLV